MGAKNARSGKKAANANLARKGKKRGLSSFARRGGAKDPSVNSKA